MGAWVDTWHSIPYRTIPWHTMAYNIIPWANQWEMSPRNNHREKWPITGPKYASVLAMKLQHHLNINPTVFEVAWTNLRWQQKKITARVCCCFFCIFLLFQGLHMRHKLNFYIAVTVLSDSKQGDVWRCVVFFGFASLFYGSH